MFNRGSQAHRRNAKIITPPPYNRGPWELRRNAISAPPLPYNRGPSKLRRSATQRPPPPYFGATTSSQKCQLLIAPMGRVIYELQQCHIVVTLPNHLTGGHVQVAEMPCIIRPHLTTGGHGSHAEMSCIPRPRLILVPLQVRRNANQLPRQWEGSQIPCSNAALPSPFPTLQQGVMNSPQKCLRKSAPTLQQGATQMTQQCYS